MMNAVKYIGDGKFVVTEDWIREVYSQAVALSGWVWTIGLVGVTLMGLLKSCILTTVRSMIHPRMSLKQPSMTG